jgi:EAL domain-containing protein (putative c-di-GMP-specific phosphodiesterase class I)
LRLLKDIGVRVAMDNFGRGYSSLSYLRGLPVDTLKIDRSVVRDVAESAESAMLILSVMGIAETLGLETLAEGIEHEAQLRAVREAGCGSGQGFLLARPLDPGAAERLFAPVS